MRLYRICIYDYVYILNVQIRIIKICSPWIVIKTNEIAKTATINFWCNIVLIEQYCLCKLINKSSKGRERKKRDGKKGIKRLEKKGKGKKKKGREKEKKRKK